MECIPNTKGLEVLLVEDNPVDAMMMLEALKEVDRPAGVHVVENGFQALEYLRGGNGGEPRRPDLVLLDLDLPDRDGREVLLEIKGDPALKSIPVVIVSGADDEESVSSSYRLEASSYVVKQAAVGDLLQGLRAVSLLWNPLSE